MLVHPSQPKSPPPPICQGIRPLVALTRLVLLYSLLSLITVDKKKGYKYWFFSYDPGFRWVLASEVLLLPLALTLRLVIGSEGALTPGNRPFLATRDVWTLKKLALRRRVPSSWL